MRKTVIPTAVLFLNLLALSLCLIAVPCMAEEVSFNKAEDISEKDIVEGSNADGEDDHLYKFEVEKNGYITISFEQKKGIGEHQITVYNPEKEEIYQVVCEEDMDILKTPEFSIGKGINYIKIHSNNNPDIYSLSVQCEKSKYWETEPNNKPDQANEIVPDKTYKGTNVKADDTDYYIFHAEEDGHITISLDHSKDLDIHQISLYDSDQKEICVLEAGKDLETFISQDIAINKGDYYLTVSSAGNKEPYKISLTYLAAEDWETEDNNNFDQADTIEINTLYYGTNLDKDDEDYYSFSLDQDSQVSINMVREKDVPDHNITIYGLDKKEITRLTVTGEQPEYTSEKISLKKGTNYIRIQSDENKEIYGFQVIK